MFLSPPSGWKLSVVKNGFLHDAGVPSTQPWARPRAWSYCKGPVGAEVGKA